MHYYFISIFIELPSGSFHGGERCCAAFLEVIVGFDMTSLKFKLKNYRSYQDFTFTMH